MSLVGNLEDLSLGDILQIISLSQKSGVLALESTQGSARILFQNGAIQSACVKGQACDLQSLLVGGGFIDPAGFEACRSRADDGDRALEEALLAETDLTQERLDTLMQEAVEGAVFEMFSWVTGDFSFDVRAGTEPSDPKLILKVAANAQYLAMEGMRLLDEGGRGAQEEEGVAIPANTPAAESEGEEADSPESAFQSLFGDETRETDGSGETATEAASAEPIAVSGAEAETVAAPVALESVESAAPHIVAARVIQNETPESGIEAGSADFEAIRKQPVVVIEPEVAGLDWLKSTIGTSFVRVHVFQKAEQGLSRIRQYMIRGEFPVVLISTAVEIDPLSGIHGLADFVKRLKTQSAGVRVVGVRERAEGDGSAKEPGISALDAVLDRPSHRQIREFDTGQNAAMRSAFAESLQQVLVDCEQERARANQKVAGGPTEIQRLRDMTEKLQAASSRGEILPAVLGFASEHFSRAAILVARDQEIFAVAGHGIPALEVDPLGASNSVTVPAHEEGWIRSAVESGRPVQAAPQTQADQRLLERFGGLKPESVFLGPISSGGGVVAVLYGDNGDTGIPLPDMSSLEVVLHHAGVALDRAALERARWEADEGGR